jgi:hypothetical protein
MGQINNNSFQGHITNAVIKAVYEAGRTYPGTSDPQMDIDVALEGMCHAIATLAAMVEQTYEERKLGTALFGAHDESSLARLRCSVEAVRAERSALR